MSARPVLEARGVAKTYQVSAGFMRSRRPLRAVDGVDLVIREGEVVALVGESGCGKTTLAKMLMGLTRPTSGTIVLDGTEIGELGRVAVASRVQPVFQDPYSSLNPRKPIRAIIKLPLVVQRDPDPASWDRRVDEMMELVGLPSRVARSYPEPTVRRPAPARRHRPRPHQPPAS